MTANTVVRAVLGRSRAMAGRCDTIPGRFTASWQTTTALRSGAISVVDYVTAGPGDAPTRSSIGFSIS